MITAKEVKNLRDLTGASMMQCKRALEESSGNVEKSVKMLQKNSSKVAGKKQDRSANEGYIGCYVHSNGKIGVLVEVNCETDFVARGNEFREFVHDLAMHIAAVNPDYISYDEIVPDIIKSKKDEFMEKAKKENKLPEITQKIVEGKIKKYFDEICLLNQPFVKDANRTISDLTAEKIARFGENIKIKRFVRFEM